MYAGRQEACLKRTSCCRLSAKYTGCFWKSGFLGGQGMIYEGSWGRWGASPLGTGGGQVGPGANSSLGSGYMCLSINQWQFTLNSRRTSCLVKIKTESPPTSFSLSPSLFPPAPSISPCISLSLSLFLAKLHSFLQSYLFFADLSLLSLINQSLNLRPSFVYLMACLQ